MWMETHLPQGSQSLCRQVMGRKLGERSNLAVLLPFCKPSLSLIEDKLL